MRRFREESAMVAPPVHDFDSALQAIVVSDASTSPAAFSRTVPLPSKQRTKSRPPSAASTSQRGEGELTGLGAAHHEGEALLRSSSSPRPVAATPVQPVEGQPARLTYRCTAAGRRGVHIPPCTCVTLLAPLRTAQAMPRIRCRRAPMPCRRSSARWPRVPSRERSTGRRRRWTAGAGPPKPSVPLPRGIAALGCLAYPGG